MREEFGVAAESWKGFEFDGSAVFRERRAADGGAGAAPQGVEENSGTWIPRKGVPGSPSSRMLPAERVPEYFSDFTHDVRAQPLPGRVVLRAGRGRRRGLLLRRLSRLLIGNVRRQPFRDIWTGEKAQRFRAKLAREPLPIGARCCGSSSTASGNALRALPSRAERGIPNSITRPRDKARDPSSLRSSVTGSPGPLYRRHIPSERGIPDSTRVGRSTLLRMTVAVRLPRTLEVEPLRRGRRMTRSRSRRRGSGCGTRLRRGKCGSLRRGSPHSLKQPSGLRRKSRAGLRSRRIGRAAPANAERASGLPKKGRMTWSSG